MLMAAAPKQPNEKSRQTLLVGAPQRTLLITAVTTRILIVLLLCLISNLPLFDSSPRLIFPATANLHKWSSTLLRWDAFHFLHIAEEGYIHEYEWAFFPGTPYMMRLLSWFHQLGRKTLPDRAESLLIEGALFSIMSEGAVALYDLTIHHTKSPSLAMLTCLLSLLSSSPATLRHASYSEPFFAALSYYGMLCCARGQWHFASLWFSLASAFRSNGILLSGFIIWGMVIYPLLCHKRPPLSTIMCCLAFSIFPFLPFAYHQYSAYRTFCLHDLTEPAPWCTNIPPLIYSYVQAKYWDMGFLRYWSLQQLPNFLISAPVLVLLLYSSTEHLVCAFLPRLWSSLSSRRTPAKQSHNGTPFHAPDITPHAIHALFLTLTLLFSAHTQIVLRLASSMPYTYWAAAKLWMDHPVWARWWTGWSVVWGVTSIVLWATFLPPA